MYEGAILVVVVAEPGAEFGADLSLPILFVGFPRVRSKINSERKIKSVKLVDFKKYNFSIMMRNYQIDEI